MARVAPWRQCDDLDVAGVITTSAPSWIAPFTGPSPSAFSKSVTQLCREGADVPGRGRPWKLSLEDRVILVAAYWRTNLTLRHWPRFLGSHQQARALVEHTFARTKTWKILRDCRLKGSSVHHAMLGIARLHNINLAG